MYHSCDIHYFFFFNDTATTEIYTLSLHDALPISAGFLRAVAADEACSTVRCPTRKRAASRYLPAKLERDRKSTRLNSSHGYISYAVFCLKKKKVHLYEVMPDVNRAKAQPDQ